MTSLAPEILRQRFMIEGYYDISVDEKVIQSYFNTLTQALNLRTYGEAIIFSPASLGKEGNQGYDAFIPLIDSGISLYVWTTQRFMSVVIYTCKSFDANQALNTTQDFFKLGQHETKSF
jgi:S-adenosylmethionine decarboxylase